MPDIGCALCGGRGISRRLDVTDSDVNTRDISDYDVRGVLRGVLACPECIATKTIGQLLNVSNGVELVRGCLVQCAAQPPWYLRKALPGGPRVWRKTVCPCCGGRATIQIIADVIEKPASAFMEGLRQAAAVLSLRRPYLEEDDYDDSDEMDSDTGQLVPDRQRVAVGSGDGRGDLGPDADTARDPDVEFRGEVERDEREDGSDTSRQTLPGLTQEITGLL